MFPENLVKQALSNMSVNLISDVEYSSIINALHNNKDGTWSIESNQYSEKLITECKKLMQDILVATA